MSATILSICICRNLLTFCFQFRAAREMGVERLIHVSALNATPNPMPKVFSVGSQFLKTKYYGELAVLEEFPNATIIRPADMYGEADDFLWYYQHAWRRMGRFLPLWKKGEQTVKAPVYGGDVAEAVVNAALDPESAGKIYQGVGPEQYILADLVDYTYGLTNRMGPWGFERTDLRFDPMTLLKVILTEKFTIGTSPLFAQLCRDRIERECVDDIIDPHALSLEDLGVRLTNIQEKVSGQGTDLIYFVHRMPNDYVSLYQYISIRLVPLFVEGIPGIRILPAKPTRLSSSESTTASFTTPWMGALRVLDFLFLFVILKAFSF